jgi:hypothetical protein
MSFPGNKGSIATTVTVLLLADACALPILVQPPPWTAQQVRPMLAEIVARRSPGDGVYAFYGAD